ncbi:MAG: hypothetical protein Q4A61_06825 [Porphyromonadaceae bacterium]|nr:hypothetical protein [Porphyromonadaceae bacterium]
MNKKIFALFLCLGLLWACNSKKEEPQLPVDSSSSGGFEIEAEADADAVGLDPEKLRGALKFDITDFERLRLIPDVQTFETHAFFRHRLKPEVLGYAKIRWEIKEYNSQTNKVKLRFSGKNLKVEKIGPGYNPNYDRNDPNNYLKIEANEVPPSGPENYYVWYVAGVMGVPDSWVDKRTGRVTIKANQGPSRGSKKVGDKIESEPVHAPLVSPFVRIRPDIKSEPRNLKKGYISNWRFLARGMMLRLEFTNRSPINLDRAPIYLTSTDNSLVGNAEIGFSSSDVTRVDANSRPKFIFDSSSRPSIRISQASHVYEVTHMLWAISKNENDETPAGVRAFIKPLPSENDEPLVRPGYSQGHRHHVFVSGKPLKNNTSWVLPIEFFRSSTQ